MKQVKLIIANTQTDTVYFNYGDDYSDVTRIFVEDHSPWEEVENSDYYDLLDFVNEYNRFKNKSQRCDFAFLIVKDQQISAQQAIAEIRKKRNEQLKKEKEEALKRKEAAEKAKHEREMEKLAKTKEQKLKLLEQLKQELGEK